MAKKASQKIKLRTDEDLVSFLRKAVRRTNDNRIELSISEKELKNKLKTSSAKRQRQISKSSQGRLVAIKAPKFKKPKVKSQVKIRTKIAAIKSVTHRSRAEYLEQAKPGFIRRFIERINASYKDWKVEWNGMLQRVLTKLTYDQLDQIMTMLNLDKMYYESNAYAVNTGATGRALYEYFVQFEAE